jgi:polygalacturonase
MNLAKLFGLQKEWDVNVPTYPLNTDGIDPAAKNVLIERVKITNHDDAVAVKPSHNTDSISQCSENIIVRDVEVHFGVGMTIGSVPPRDSYACVRNVTFSNITFHHPYKSIYVKTNPGHTTSMLPGSGGEITDITYEDITIHNPIWWNIYVGPQQ